MYPSRDVTTVNFKYDQKRDLKLEIPNDGGRSFKNCLNQYLPK